MKIELAKSAGFCFGVTRAIKMIYKALDENKKICTLGNIIHNQSMINELVSKGVRVIDDISEIKEGEMVVIRSHGISKHLYSELPEDIILDGTCPFVSKIHKIVSDFFIDNQTQEIIEKNKIFVIIIGDKNHPEIKGIEGHCIYDFITIADSIELQQFLKNNINDLKNKYIKVVTQTTYKSEELQNCADVLDLYLKNSYEIFDTICNETKKRQTEAFEMSKIKDLMIVIGGRNSSNTQKLFDVCSKNCKTIFIENCQDLEQYDLKNYKNIGVTAGASTPSNIIVDVISKLKNLQQGLNKKNNIAQEDQDNIDFKSEIDKFCDCDNLSKGDIVKGKVINIFSKEIQIDIGNRYDAYLPFSEISYKKYDDLYDLIKINDVLDLVVIDIDDSVGLITLSKKRLDKLGATDRIEDAYKNNLTVEGTVKKVLNDGVIVSVYGVNVYINEFQLCLDRNQNNIEDLLDKDILFKITYFDRKNNKIKGSVRELKKEIFWSERKVGDKLTAVVKSLTNFGAFVELDGEEGLIFISDLSWKKIKHPSEVLKIGDIIEVRVKNLDFEKKRITLEYKKPEDNPWTIIEKQYKIGDIVDATVVSITPFGAFAQILPGIEGLIHISEISQQFVKSVNDFLVVGNNVKVKIKEIDLDKKKIFLSLKSLD